MSKCLISTPAARALLTCMQHVVPDITHKSALYLDYNVEPELELPFVTLLACSYLAIWTAHKDDKALTPSQLKAALQVRVHTLEHTLKHQEAAEKLKNLLITLS